VEFSHDGCVPQTVTVFVQKFSVGETALVNPIILHKKPNLS